MAADTVRHFIGGQHVRSALGKTFGVTDPATGKPYAQVEVGVAGDANQAVLAAKAALETGPWAGLTVPDRARALHALADATDARLDDIAAAEAQGTGLPVAQARQQSERGRDVFRQAAEMITAGPAPEASCAPDEPGYVVTRPVGVVGLVTSWRTPFLAQARAVAPALAAGCTIVLRPAEWAPLPAALLAQIATAAGLPDGVLNIVHGSLHPKAPGDQARDALIGHPAVARLSFAGEAAARQQVSLDAAAHHKELSVEFAGNAPCLIFADADLGRAADSALFGAFALNGQRRTATSTVLVERPVYDAVVSRLSEGAAGIRVGEPADPATEVGPMPYAEQYDQLTAWVRRGLREGARLTAGGRRPPGLPEGNYLAPTVLADVTLSMQVFTEQVCGPVVRVAAFDTEEEAVSLANAGLAPAAYVWTSDLARAQRLAPAMAAASTWVNSPNSADRLGRSGDVRAGVEFFTRSTAVVVGEDDAPVPRFGG